MKYTRRLDMEFKRTLPLYFLFRLHIQGEIGVGVPGLRGERGDLGPRVMSMTNLNFVHLLVCSSDCDGGCICLIILGRRRSAWNRWRERPYCKYTPFCLRHSAFPHYFLPRQILFSIHIDIVSFS